MVPRTEGAADFDFQTVEMQAEKLSADIEQRKSRNNRKKEQLSLLANKYELLKTELEMIEVEVQAKISAVEEHHIKPLLVVEKKVCDKILDDRQHLEEDLTREFVAKASKKGKVSREAVREFKMEFNKKMDAQFELVAFRKASEKEQLQREEEIWKRILMEYTNILENTMFLKDALPSAGPDAENFAAIIKQNEQKVANTS